MTFVGFSNFGSEDRFGCHGIDVCACRWQDGWLAGGRAGLSEAETGNGAV